MIRTFNRSLLATTIAVSVLLSACGNDPAPTPIPPIPAPPPRVPVPATEVATPADEASVAAAVSVVAVDLGNDVDDDGRVRAVLATFQPKDTIHASISTDGSAPTPTKLGVRWSYRDGGLIRADSKDFALVSPAITDFSVSKPDGWVPGKYKVEILLNGTVVQTKDFEVAVQVQ